MLDPRLANWLRDYNARLAELEVQGFQLTPETARAGLARITETMVQVDIDLDRVIDDCVIDDGIEVPIRIYQPDAERELPLLIYLHGGGHMSGSVDVYDGICRQLAREARHILVSIDYRLAPEHPYPAGMEDALAVIDAIPELLNRHGIGFRGRPALAGDSGGAAMTASVAHRLQHDQAHPLRAQLLIYPSLDYSMSQPSLDENATGYFLHKDKIAWLFDHYFQHDEDRRAMSPLYMPIEGQMPPTMVITAQFCPLRDEGVAYVKRLTEHGVACEHRHFDDMVHAFLNLQAVVPGQCARAYLEIAEFLNSIN